MSQERDPSANGHGGLFERFVHSEVSGSIVLLVIFFAPKSGTSPILSLRVVPWP